LRRHFWAWLLPVAQTSVADMADVVSTISAHAFTDGRAQTAVSASARRAWLGPTELNTILMVGLSVLTEVSATALRESVIALISTRVRLVSAALAPTTAVDKEHANTRTASVS